MKEDGKPFMDNDINDDKTLIDKKENNVSSKSENTVSDNENKTEEEIDEKTGKKKVIDQQTAFMVGGGVLVAGTSYAAGANVDEVMVDTDNDDVADTILTDENNDGVFNTHNESTSVESSNSEHTSGHPFNINTAPHASEGTVNDKMSFKEAFAAARKELGPGGVFEWNGKLYGTFYATEVDENHNPIIEYDTVENSETDVNEEGNENEEVLADEVENDENVNTEDEQEEVEVDTEDEQEEVEVDIDDVQEETEVNIDDVQEEVEGEVTNQDLEDTDEPVDNEEVTAEVVDIDEVEEETVDTDDISNTFDDDSDDPFFDGETVAGIPEVIPNDTIDVNDDLANLNDDFEDIDDYV